MRNKKEIWKDVVGYEGKYMVSNLGRVKALNYKRGDTCNIMAQYPNRNGYLMVGLSKNGKHRKWRVHRLVAIAFIPNPNNYPEVNHKDEDKTNNCVENLEWCDSKYNNGYGTHRTRNAIPILQYDYKGNLIKEWESARQVERETGYKNGHIIDCCKGRLKRVYGYIWKQKKVA